MKLFMTGGSGFVGLTGLRDAMSALWTLSKLARDGANAVVPKAGVQDWVKLLQGRYSQFSYQTSERNDCTVAAHGLLSRTPLSTQRLREDLGFQPQYGVKTSFDHDMEWLETHPIALTPSPHR